MFHIFQTGAALAKLVQEQENMGKMVAALGEANNEVMKSNILLLKQELLREKLSQPSKAAWVAAVTLLILVIAFLGISLRGSFEQASDSNDAVAMHQQADTYRAQALGALIESRSSNGTIDNSKLKTAKDVLKAANDLDSDATKLNSSGGLQLFTQLNINGASAFSWRNTRMDNNSAPYLPGKRKWSRFR